MRKERRQLLTIGIIAPFVTGAITFCSVVPLVAVINWLRPHLPWIPKVEPEPPLQTAWACARFATVLMFVVWGFLFAFLPKMPPPRRAKQKQ